MQAAVCTIKNGRMNKGETCSRPTRQNERRERFAFKESLIDSRMKVTFLDNKTGD